MIEKPSKGTFELTETCFYPLLCSLYVCGPIWDRTITPNIVMVDAIIIEFKLTVYTEVLLHKFVLKEETSITEVACDHR